MEILFKEFEKFRNSKFKTFKIESCKRSSTLETFGFKSEELLGSLLLNIFLPPKSSKVPKVPKLVDFKTLNLAEFVFRI